MTERNKKDPANADTLASRAYAKAKKQQYADALTLYDAAVEAAPKKGSIWAARGGLLAVMGDYKRAIADFERAVSLGDQSMAQHIGGLKRALRQMTDDVPPVGWEPNYDKYSNVAEDFAPQGGWLAYMMVDRLEDLPSPKAGEAVSTLGAPGTKLGFRGTEEKPIDFAIKFWVWDGAWINDPKYGLLLTNGTKFKRDVIEGSKRVVYTGEVRNWRFTTLRTQKEAIDAE